MIVFDCESVGRLEAVDLLGPVKAPGNIKDPAKIAAAIAEKLEKRREDAALDCDVNGIASIAWATSEDEITCLDAGTYTEAQMLREFWTCLVDHWREYPSSPLVGFFCVSFDLPTIIRASQRLSVPHPRLELGRYRYDNRIVDLAQELTWKGLVDPKTLTVYCRLFGLDVPDDDSSGADIGGFVAAGAWDKVILHNVADVRKTWALAAYLGIG